ncbi:MAG: FAD-dependent oxidoreductase [Planctomycetes bacterium]|nr:FAD-dependent oxidoreductase [Planctomycetota bacterium]
MKLLKTDVLICGGGCAGLCAALASARNGAETLVVERAGFAGGIITAVGLPYFDGVAHKKDRRLVLGGIPIELLVRSGICQAGDTHVTKYNPTISNIERFKLLADQMFMAEAPRLQVLYHTQVCDVKADGGRIQEVILANKDGLVRVQAREVVDCTGDGDVAAWSGAPVIKTQPLQPLTLHFRIGNVKKSPDMQKLCRAQLEVAHQAGELPNYYGPGMMFMFAPNEVYLHAIRVPGDASDAADLTRCEMQGRADAWTMFERWKANVPGFEDSYFLMASPFIGVRETRRIVGQHVLHESDIQQGRKFDDAVATGCWYLDIHPQTATSGSAWHEEPDFPAPYDIPYRSIQPKQIENLLVAGRCHSATALASSSSRVTATAMAMGQAAGTAAALAVETKKSTGELAGVAVRRRLEAQHAGPWVGA